MKKAWHPLRVNPSVQRGVMAELADGHAINVIAKRRCLGWETVAAFRAVLLYGSADDFAAWCENRIGVLTIIKEWREAAEG